MSVPHTGQIISVTLRLDKTCCPVIIVVKEIPNESPALRDIILYYLVNCIVASILFIYKYLHCF